MRLLIQPGDGVAPVTRAIAQAKESVEIIIFRLDEREVERTLIEAVRRGVRVHALIAHTNRAGEDRLRQLELRLLAGGVTVARTSDDLVRYHGKMLLVDRRELFVLAFNFTRQDTRRSRSFGLVTRSRDLVREAGRLFDADVKRHSYEACSSKFLVSPVNARRELAAFLKSAKKQLLIYDPEVSDPAMIELLQARVRAGVDVRVVGKLARKAASLDCGRLPMRLHTRTIIVDGKAAFVGSQSLRELELDSRREIGIICRDAKVVNRIREIFEEDWTRIQSDGSTNAASRPAGKVAKKIAKAVVEAMPPVAPAVQDMVRTMVGDSQVILDSEEVEAIVKDAVKDAVKEAVKAAVGGSAATSGEPVK